MENVKLNEILKIATRKETFYNKSKLGYSFSSMMAGAYCSFGMILALTVSGQLSANEYTAGFASIMFGVSFAMALTLITFAGAELFTGNILSLSMSTMAKNTKLINTVKLLFVCYISNFIGAAIISIIIGGTGLLNNEIVGKYVVMKTEMKMSLSFMQAFTRGILCNALICVAVWCNTVMKSEVAKMVIIFWCIYSFCASGYEHSIANMGLFVMAKTSIYATDAINIQGALNNIIPVTLGNIVGGAVVVGFIYYIIGKEQEK